jgi:hypothetical protein
VGRLGRAQARAIDVQQPVTLDAGLGARSRAEDGELTGSGHAIAVVDVAVTEPDGAGGGGDLEDLGSVHQAVGWNVRPAARAQGSVVDSEEDSASLHPLVSKDGPQRLALRVAHPAGGDTRHQRHARRREPDGGHVVPDELDYGENSLAAMLGEIGAQAVAERLLEQLVAGGLRCVAVVVARDDRQPIAPTGQRGAGGLELLG